MARFTFGGTLYDISATQISVVTAVTLNPDDTVTSVTTGQGLALAAPETEVAFYDAVGGTLQTDFLLWSNIDNDWTVEASAIETDASGYLPQFKGPDGLEVLYDAAGKMFRSWEADAGGGGGASAVDDLTDIGTVGSDVAKANTEAEARTAIGAASASTWVQDNILGETSAADILTALGLDAYLTDFLQSNGYVREFYGGPGDAVPAMNEGDAYDELVSEVLAERTVTNVLAEATTAGGTTNLTTTTTPAALGADTVCTAWVAAYDSDGGAAVPTSFTGMGLTWTRIPYSTETNAAGNQAGAAYIGTGTGTATAIDIDFASAVTRAHVIIDQLEGVNGDLAQDAVAARSTSAAPSITLGSVPTGQGIVMIWALQAAEAQTLTPGTGWTPSTTYVATPGMRSRSAYAIPGSQSASWTAASGYNKLLVIAEIV